MKPVSSEILDRCPPSDIESERAVIGSLLLDPARIRDVAGIVSPADFYADANQRIFRHLCQMDDAGEKVDTLLLTNRLRAAKELEAAGGTVALAECLQSVPVADNALYYARTVAEKAASRRNIQVACNLLTASYVDDGDAGAVAATAIRVLQQGMDASTDEGPVLMLDAAVAAFERIERVAEQQRGFGLPTGLAAYDQDNGGLFPGELIVLAARPGMGKTSLALQIAWYCGENNRGVYFASAEMSAEELATRVTCGHAPVSSRKVRTGTLSDEDVSQLGKASSVLGQMPWWVDDGRLTTERIRRCCRKLAAKDELRLVVVDYLQLLRPVDTRPPRHEQVATMASDLKRLARELQVPVLCLVQLSREAIKDRRPRLHHLRESGAIEQDADVVGFLHEPESRGERQCALGNPGAIDIDWTTDKNRNAETGRIELEFIKARTLFACAGVPLNTHGEFDSFDRGEF